MTSVIIRNLRHYFSGLGGICLIFSVFITGCGKTLSGTDSHEDNFNNNASNSIFLSGYLTPQAIVSSTPISSSNEGFADFVYDQDTGSLYGDVSVNASNVTGVQLRREVAGKNGALEIDLIVSASDSNLWQVPGSLTLDNDAINALLKGKFYVQVNTSTYQGGELRSQILRDNQEVYINEITAEQVVTSESTSAGSGVSYLTVDYSTGDLESIVRFRGGFVANQISLRAATAGQQGDDISELVSDGSEPSTWELPGKVTLDNDRLNQLSSGGLYFRADTDAYPDGELRGQILPDQMELRVRLLTNLGAVPPSGSSAFGKAFVTIDYGSGRVQGILKYSGLVPTGAVIDKINNIDNPNSAMTIVEWVRGVDVWQLPADSTFGKNDINALWSNNLYILLQSVQYPEGEIGAML